MQKTTRDDGGGLGQRGIYWRRRGHRNQKANDHQMRQPVHSSTYRRQIESPRANEIIKLASAFFAQAELDRKLKS